MITLILALIADLCYYILPVSLLSFIWTGNLVMLKIAGTSLILNTLLSDELTNDSYNNFNDGEQME